MKYKLIGAVALILAVSVVIGGAWIFSDGEKERYVQHRMEAGYSPCDVCPDTSLCTHLPIIKIDTGGVEIPGEAYLDPVSGKVLHGMAADGNKTIAATADVIDSKEGNNHPSDESTLSSNIRIRIRGNSSRFFDKLPYLIELVNEDGTNNDREMMGMAAHHEWALHGPFLDKTLIRNYMWYNLAGEIMDYSPNVRFCELILNGEYKGLYLMTETVTAGDEDARIKLSTTEKRNTFSGYILRHDRGSETEIKNIAPFSIYTLQTDNLINIVSPGLASLDTELTRNIELEFSDFEKALYSYDFDDERGYKTTVDVDSFVDYFIINEVALNRDAGYYSTYVYKDVDRKYKLCVWDFNNALDNYEETDNPTSGFSMFSTVWFDRIIQDEDFTERVIDRYKYLRTTVLSDEKLNAYIDETVAWLGAAVDRNFEVWGYSFEESADRLIPKERNLRSYDDALAQMRNCLNERVKWMDDNIESLKQYSAASKTRGSHETHEH